MRAGGEFKPHMVANGGCLGKFCADETAVFSAWAVLFTGKSDGRPNRYRPLLPQSARSRPNRRCGRSGLRGRKQAAAFGMGDVAVELFHQIAQDFIVFLRQDAFGQIHQFIARHVSCFPTVPPRPFRRPQPPVSGFLPVRRRLLLRFRRCFRFLSRCGCRR